MKKYIPKMYQPSIYDIPYEVLKEKGITHLLFDLDNTIIPPHIGKANKKTKDLFGRLKKMGFTIIIFSNSGKKRVEPFGSYLEVEVHPSSIKPLRKGFYHVFNQYDLKKEQVTIIGDQLVTDIIGGNRVGIMTILIDPISSKDKIFTKWNRLREHYILQKLKKENLFEKGNYYESKM